MGFMNVNIGILVKLTRKEKRVLMAKLAPPVQEQLISLVNKKQYTWTEIGDRTGIGRSHATRLGHGKEVLRESYLKPLMAVGIIDMPKILEKVDLGNPKEVQYLRRLRYMDDEELMNIVDVLKEAGEDVANILKGYALAKGHLK